MKRRIFAFLLALVLVSGAAFPAYYAQAAEDGSGLPCDCGHDPHSDDCMIYQTSGEPEESQTPADPVDPCTCTPVDGVHQACCPLYVEPVTPAPGYICDDCGAEAADEESVVHNPECIVYTIDTCTCGSPSWHRDEHAPTCPLNPNYSIPDAEPEEPEDSFAPPAPPSDPYCTCGSLDGTHSPECLRAYAKVVRKDTQTMELTMKPSESVTFLFDQEKPQSFVYADGQGGGGDLLLSENDTAVFQVPATALAGKTYQIIAVWDNVKFDIKDPLSWVGASISVVANVTVAESDPDPVEMEESRTLGDGETTVLVSGQKPVGTELKIADVDANEVLDTSVYGLNENHVAFEISLTNKAQPVGGVNLTVDSEKLGLKPGDDFIVYHIHDGKTEILGPFQADENGKANFIVSGFSYIIVGNSTVNIPNISSYYEAFGTSNNDAHQIIGVYYVGENANILIASHNGSNLKEPNSISINGGQQFAPTGFEKYSIVTELKLTDDDGKTIITDLLSKTDNGYIWTIDLGPNVPITDPFDITVIMDKGNGGHDIKCDDVDVSINYNIEKFVYRAGSGYSADVQPDPELPVEVNRNDEIIYKVVISNPGGELGSIAVSGATVKDALPAGLYKAGSVYIAEDTPTFGDTAATVDADGYVVLDSDVTLEPGATKTYFVKLTVKDDAEGKEYDNVAVFTGGNIKIDDEDNAKVYIPPTGDLIVAKTVTTNRTDITAPDIEFAFTLQVSTEEDKKPEDYATFRTEITPGGYGTTVVPGTIKHKGTFNLKAGDKIEIFGLPADAVCTVVENMTGDTYKGFTCSSDENSDENVISMSQKIESGEKVRIEYVNQYSLYDLVINKNVVGEVEENQSFVFEVTGPDGYKQEVVIHGTTPATIKYLYAGEYTVTEKINWSWRYNGDGTQSVTLGGDVTTGSVTFTNTHTNDKWLSGSNWRDNLWIDHSSDQGTRHDGE